MTNKMEKQMIVSASLCDSTSRLSLPSVFSVFMDLAGEHGPEIDLGMKSLMAKGLFWLTVKTKIRVYNLPEMLSTVTAVTWPEIPGKIRCNRYYQILDGDTVLVEGKTEWAIMEIATGKIIRPSNIYPENLVHLDKKILEEPFVRIDENFDDGVFLDTYKVRSTDIDLGKHLNNAIYPRIFLGAFSLEELSNLNITDAEINFRSPCFEGDLLTIKKRIGEGFIDLGLIKENGKISATMRLTIK